MKRLLMVVLLGLFLSGCSSVESILGFDSVTEVSSSVPGLVVNQYYYGDSLVAETFAPESSSIETYSVDLDEDGVDEFVANCTFADGAERVLVYRNVLGQIELGRLEYPVYSLPGSVHEYYSPDLNAFVVVSPTATKVMYWSDLVFEKFA